MSFGLFVIILLIVNAISFVLTFRGLITKDYGAASPQVMLKKVTAAYTENKISNGLIQELKQNQIWAMFLNSDGESIWSLDLPEYVPESYSLQEVAVFAKGYIEDYPVFIRNTDDGLLILGYPKRKSSKIRSRLLHLLIPSPMVSLFLSPLMENYPRLQKV